MGSNDPPLALTKWYEYTKSRLPPGCRGWTGSGITGASSVSAATRADEESAPRPR